MNKRNLVILLVIIIGVLFYKIFADLQSLHNEIFSIKWNDILTLQLKQASYDTVVLDPIEKGYGRLNSNSGFFFVSCEDAQPYLDGYKVIMNIGNPTTATYNGFKLKVKWGKQFVSKEMNYIVWQKSLKTAEKKFTDKLMPASWNKIELILSPAKPEEVRYIEFSIETDQILLYNKNE